MSDIAQLGFAVDTGGLKRGERALDSYANRGEKTEKSLDKSVGKMNKGFLNLKNSIGLAALALAGIGTKNLFSGVIDESRELESSLFKIDALIKSTGKSAQITSEELHNSAKMMARGTLESTDEIMRAQAILLTFKNVAVDSYDEVTETAINLSRVTGQSLTSSMMQLGKALEDPTRGMTAMARSGVSFTQTQIELGKELVKTGDALGAQRLILDELASQYGGVAKKEAEGFAGSEDSLAQSIQELSINMDKSIGLTASLGSSYSNLAGGVDILAENTDALVDAAKTFGAVVGVAMSAQLAKIAISTGATAASTIAYNIQLAKMAGLTGAYAVKAGIATVATRALGVAVKFMLGPFGLLLTAIGAAAAVFITSKNNADEFTNSLESQKKIVDELEASYAKMTDKAVGSAYVEAQKTLIAIDAQRLEITKKIGDLTGKSDPASHGMLISLKAQLDNINESAKSPQQRLDAIQSIFDKGINAIEWIDPVKEAADAASKVSQEYQKWLDKVNEFQTPLQKLQAELKTVNSALASGDLEMNSGVAGYINNLTASIASLNEKAADTTYQDWIDSITSETTIGRMASLEEEILKVQKAIEAGDIDKATGLEYLDLMEEKVKSLQKTLSGAEMFNMIGDSAKDALASVQGLSEQGSKEYRQLGVAIQAVSALQAVFAVLNQASGDPYTAFGRMAAMVGAVAALGHSVGGLSGGFSDTSEQAQASQGLNVWGEKSESISNSIDITASATSKLVGINEGMLKALQAVQLGASKSAGIVSKGAAGAEFGFNADVNENIYSNVAKWTGKATKAVDDVLFFGANVVGLLDEVSNFIPNLLGKWLGGSSSVVDSGVKLLGGSLEDILSGVIVQAYQVTESKKYKWSSKKTHENVAGLSEAGKQFTLVLGSLADSVLAGASILGISEAEATRALEQYEIATTKISLKGLSADAQQKELEAVFSSIFDGMAGAVVPFLDDFQKVGEGLGETLSRVSTEIAIMGILTKSLGATMSDKLANPQLYAQISTNLSDMVGGIEEFATKTSEFMDAFAPESVKLSLHQDALTETLKAVGLELPKTADGFWQLMQGLDATTDAGREQIAALLNSTSAAEEYYKLLESTGSALKSLSSSLRDVIKGAYATSGAVSMVSLDNALSAARGGDFSQALKLNTGSLMPSQGNFSSLAEFSVQQAITANKMAELADLADGQKTIEMLSLDAAETQVELLSSINNTLKGSPETAQGASSNEDVIIELRKVREELEFAKHAQMSIAEHSAATASNTDKMYRDGVDVRVEA